MMPLVFIGIFLVVVAAVIYVVKYLIKVRVKTVRNMHLIEKGEICYTDLSVPAKPLFSRRYLLAGKPDYIVRNTRSIIPVEVKTGWSERTPYKGHVLQLAAYCQILEDAEGCFVPYGILVYDGKQRFKVRFDPSLRFELEQTIQRMRQDQQNGRNIQRNHDESQRCAACSLQVYCDEKLV